MASHSHRGVAAGTLLLLATCLLAACASPKRGPAVPQAMVDRATVLNLPAVRTWDDAINPAFKAELVRATQREKALRQQAGHENLAPAYFLAISGGGANGAYGAGILCGWTASGKRPEFRYVSGVSTGALTAPFAFLGPKYDERLKRVYTTVKSEDIASSRGALAALYNDALMDTTPLSKLMDQLVDEQMMKEIAREYDKGRILLVATTNMDADRGVLWNVGAIAASGDPNALTLIHQILLASAAIPGAFPPVMIDVQADGKPYQEMHVDGGARAQVFLYPPSFRLQAEAAALGFDRQRIGYVIRNSRLDPQWGAIERRTLSIAMRAINSLIQTQGIGDLYRIYVLTQRDNVDFNLAYIPSTFQEEPQEAFDPKYMTRLFETGFELAKNGYPWEKRPPGYAIERMDRSAEVDTGATPGTGR